MNPEFFASYGKMYKYLNPKSIAGLRPFNLTEYSPNPRNNSILYS